jgi:hypothetical protein
VILCKNILYLSCKEKCHRKELSKWIRIPNIAVLSKNLVVQLFMAAGWFKPILLRFILYMERAAGFEPEIVKQTVATFPISYLLVPVQCK